MSKFDTKRLSNNDPRKICDTNFNLIASIQKVGG